MFVFEKYDNLINYDRFLKCVCQTNLFHQKYEVLHTDFILTPLAYIFSDNLNQKKVTNFNQTLNQQFTVLLLKCVLGLDLTPLFVFNLLKCKLKIQMKQKVKMKKQNLFESKFNILLQMLIKETIVLLLIFAMITHCHQQDKITNDTLEIQQQVEGPIDQQQLEQQLDQDRVEEVNFVINSYFQNCHIDQESQVVYNCSMPKQNYAEFLYALFHKQMIRNFLKYYQLEGKLQKQTEIQEMYKVGQKVHQQVVEAYNDWILIYKPNPRIEVQEMYSDVVDLDANVLDVIEHDLQRHHEFVNVLKKVFKIKNDAKRYIVMGNKTSEQIAEDFAGIAKLYFGDCAPLVDCKLSLKAFALFVKQFSFYITPLNDELQGQQDILVSEEMDFEATQFLLKEVQKIKQNLGQTVEYSELQQYSEKLAMSLFTYLKDQVQTKEASSEQKGEKVNDKANQSHQL